MPKIIKTITPSVFFLGIFIFVILEVPYPSSITQANLTQLISFFLPLFLMFAFTVNIFLKNILSSCSISLGLNFLLVLKALDSLNLVTTVLILISVGLLVSYFRNSEKRSLSPVKTDLTKLPKIPKLTK